jgi:hypothetical protein
MFPVRYELNFYINLLRNSVFKGLILAILSELEISGEEKWQGASCSVLGLERAQNAVYLV